jgi:hypothetical protein
MPGPEELPLPARHALNALQQRLESLYQLEPAPDIVPFVQVEQSGREQVLVRSSGDSLELKVLLPAISVEMLGAQTRERNMDAYLGALEGVSHFTHLAERARTRLPTTLLELELQAEVDKFALLVESNADQSLHALRTLHRRLYENVQFLHEQGTELGTRYRLANDLAARLWAAWLGSAGSDAVQLELRRFYRAGQTDKIRMALAA